MAAPGLWAPFGRHRWRYPASRVLVTPNDPGQSYLLLKVLNQQSKVIGGRGSPMPLGKPLSDAQTCILISWIKSGAD